MFNKHKTFKKGMHIDKFDVSPEFKEKVKIAYLHTNLTYNKIVERQNGERRLIIDCGRPHEEFFAQFYLDNKDELENTDISLNTINEIIEELENEYEQELLKAKDLLKKNKLKDEADFINKMDNSVFCDEIIKRAGGWKKFSNLVMEDIHDIER